MTLVQILVTKRRGSRDVQHFGTRSITRCYLYIHLHKDGLYPVYEVKQFIMLCGFNNLADMVFSYFSVEAKSGNQSSFGSLFHRRWLATEDILPLKRLCTYRAIHLQFLVD
jgi:hypothetical protein